MSVIAMNTFTTIGQLAWYLLDLSQAFSLFLFLARSFSSAFHPSMNSSSLWQALSAFLEQDTDAERYDTADKVAALMLFTFR